MKLAILITLAVTVTSCAGIVYHEKMLPDGITWEITIDQTFKRSIRYVERESILRAKIAKRAKEICGVKPARTFACKTRESNSVLTCYFECFSKKVIPTGTEDLVAP